MINLLIWVFIFFNFFYLIGRLKKDFSIADTAWALSYVLIYLNGFYYSSDQLSTREVLVGLLTIIWAVRLSGYILYRSLRVIKEEDYRYKQWREEWGEKANLIAYFRVFILQGLMALAMASPLYLIHQNFNGQSAPEFGTTLDYLGVILWVIGFLFEAVGDYQKHMFKKDPSNKGKVLNTGLWRYTRHPNYFGEALLWWGIFLIIINQVPIYFAFIGPLLLHFFLLKVSGVAMLERKYSGDDKYKEYKEKTNAFIPWFPKKL